MIKIAIIDDEKEMSSILSNYVNKINTLKKRI